MRGDPIASSVTVGCPTGEHRRGSGCHDNHERPACTESGYFRPHEGHTEWWVGVCDTTTSTALPPDTTLPPDPPDITLPGDTTTTTSTTTRPVTTTTPAVTTTTPLVTTPVSPCQTALDDLAQSIHIIAGATGVDPETSVGITQIVETSRLSSLWLVYISGPNIGSSVPDTPPLGACDPNPAFGWAWSITPNWTDSTGCGSTSSSCTYRVTDPAAIGNTFNVSITPSALDSGARTYGSTSTVTVQAVAGSAP